MNRYAVGPQQASNIPGTDRSGIPYTMVWKQNFPHEGEYKFRGICDHKAKVYFDGEFLMDLPGMRGLRRNREKPSDLKSVYVNKSGPHQIKIELQNEVVKTVEQRTITSEKSKNRKTDVEFVLAQTELVVIEESNLFLQIRMTLMILLPLIIWKRVLIGIR